MKSIFLSIFLLFVSRANADLKFVGQDYPPLNYNDGSKVVGAMNEIIQTACLSISEKCSIEIQPLKRATTSLETGDVTGVVTLIQTKERDALAAYYPIYKSNQVYWSQSGMANMNKLEDLKGKTSVAVVSSASLKLANEHAAAVSGVTVQDEADNETILRKLAGNRFGENGVALVNELPGNFYIKKNGITNLKVAYTIKSEIYGIYFPVKNRNEAIFKKLIDQLDTMKKDGTLKKLLAKYGVDSL